VSKGVPGGLAIHIKGQVSTWKSSFQSRQEAAQGLQLMSNRGLVDQRDEPYMNAYIPQYHRADLDFHGHNGTQLGDYYRGNS
jgi:hypothetical protein